MSQERFVVRICGCHRQSEGLHTVVVTGRPQAITVAERIGPFSEKKPIRDFLEERPVTGEFDYGCTWVYSQGACATSNGVHWASIGPVHEEV